MMLTASRAAVLAVVSTLSLAGATSADTRGIDIERGPYLQRGTPTQITIRWRTNWPITSKVWYGPAPNALNQSEQDSGFQFDHKLTLTGLAPGTKYYYAVGTTFQVLAGGDEDHYFVTPPPAGDDSPTRVWVLGDSGTANDDAAAVRDAYYNYAGSEHTDLWLMLGDNAYDEGTDDEYQDAVFDMYPEMLRKSVLWPTRGNHEVWGFVYFGIFSLPQHGEAGGVPSGTEAYYSFDHANIHFVCLDSFASSPLVGDAMWTWLEADLASNDQDWTIAFWHHPPYSKGSHDSDTELGLILMRTQILPLLEDWGVDLVLSGHSHVYERSYLIDGHYGFSPSFGPQHVVDGGDGREEGTGAYRKEPTPHAGAVYIVAGSSGRTAGGSFDHPAMFVSTPTLGSVVLDVDGGRLDVTMLASTGDELDHLTLLQEPYSGTYCTPTTTSAGCQARVDVSGTPSISSPDPFEIRATDVVAQEFGLFFYGFEHAQVPFGDGFRCVDAPLTRTPAQASGGTGPCGGELSFDFNAYLDGLPQPSAFLGVEVFGQYWYRDPASSLGSAMSDAVQFTVEP